MKIHYNKNILIIPDAFNTAGLGHIKRTEVIAQFFRYNYNVKIYYYIEKNSIQKSYIQESENNVIEYDPKFNEQTLTNDIINQIKIHNIGICIIDSYTYSENIYNKISSLNNLVTLTIDDYNRLLFYSSDFLLNYNPLSQRFDYNCSYKTEKLLGLNYLLLNKTFIDLKNKDYKKSITKNIVITMGGSDPDNITYKICKALSNFNSEYKFKIIIGQNYIYTEKLKNDFANIKSYEFFENPDNLTEIFFNSDFAITSCGLTCWELLFLNVPLIALSISKDQDLNLEYLIENQLCLYGLKIDNYQEKNFIKKLQSILSDEELINKIKGNVSNLFREYSGVKNIADKLIFKHKLKELRKLYPLKYSSKKQIISEYTETSFQKEKYQKLRWGSKEGMYNRFNLLSNLIKKYKLKNILDIGCGTCDLNYYLKKYHNNINYFGMDLTFNILKYSDNNIKSKSVNADVEYIPFRNNYFDLVSLIGIVQNCGVKLDIIFKKVRNVLNTNGFLFFMTKNLCWEKFLTDELIPEIDHNWFLEEEIENDLYNNNFEIIEKNGFLPRTNEIVKPVQSHEIFYLTKLK